MLLWALPPGKPPGYHDEYIRNFPHGSRKWKVEVVIVKYTQRLLHNKYPLFGGGGDWTLPENYLVWGKFIASILAPSTFPVQ